MKEYKIVKPAIAILIILLALNIALIGYSKYIEHVEIKSVNEDLKQIEKSLDSLEESVEDFNSLFGNFREE